MLVARIEMASIHWLFTYPPTKACGWRDEENPCFHKVGRLISITVIYLSIQVKFVHNIELFLQNSKFSSVLANTSCWLISLSFADI